MDKNLLRGSLYYTHADSCASIEKAQGVVVGVATTLMAMGKSYDKAIEIIVANLPSGYRAKAIPSAWRKDIP